MAEVKWTVIGPTRKAYIVADSAAEGSPLLIKLNDVRRFRISHVDGIEATGLAISASEAGISAGDEIVTGIS